jgi:general secretion pathway protein K
MTPALFAQVKPALTVYSGRQFIDPQVAPREALLALPGMDPTPRGVDHRRANKPAIHRPKQ